MLNQKGTLLAAMLLIFTTLLQAQTLRVATYNVRNANKGDSANGNGWGQRLPVISSLIQFHDFELFGTQEAKHNQLTDLKENLPGYDFIGIGRDDGKEAGEYSAIFYKKDRFTLLKKGDFWMAPITDRPNKGWDAALPRLCSWGQFTDNKTGFTFYFFNLHMDHIGVKARAESAKLVMAKIKEIAGSAPTILSGDFNVDQNNESYTLINTSGWLKDVYELAPVRYAWSGTFNNFESQSKTDSRIDHIFATKQFTVSRYGIVTDSYRTTENDTATTRMPSDHFPVMAEIEYKK